MRIGHFLCIISGKNVTEVACGNNNVDFVAVVDFTLFEQVTVCGEIINDLRSKTTPVDGVCGRKSKTVFCK